MEPSISADIAGIVLASGASRRFGSSNKLLAPIGGVPIIYRTVKTYVDAGLSPVYVVVGHDAQHVAGALSRLEAQIVHNPDFEQGQSRALVRGVRSLPAEAQAAVIGVGDQPLLTASIIRGLVALYRDASALLAVPRYAGRRGNPVLVDRALFGELLEVTGDQGGRPVLERHRTEIAWLDIADERAGMDLDTPEEYERLLRG